MEFDQVYLVETDGLNEKYAKYAMNRCRSTKFITFFKDEDGNPILQTYRNPETGMLMEERITETDQRLII